MANPRQNPQFEVSIGPGWPHRVARVSLILSGFLLAGLTLRAQEGDNTVEYRIKAAFLYNFTKFVDWPPAAYREDHAPFVIAVVAREPKAAAIIEEVLRNKKTLSGRAIVVVAMGESDPIPVGCQLLYLGESAVEEWTRLRRQIADRPVLVVGETKGFAQHGGTINFVVAGDAVHIEINPKRAERVGLKVSGSLASVAQLVWDKEPD